MTQKASVFLSANWRWLIFINYKINPDKLKPYLPYGTELDFYKGKTYISLVAFLFQNTKLFGTLPILGFQNFEEVNLRFYVIRKKSNQRGVVFIKEFVPKPLLAYIARTIYKEHYQSTSMSHQIYKKKDNCSQLIKYCWGQSHLCIDTNKEILTVTDQSYERWITEHYWGYTKLTSNKTYEYQVVHPVWDLHQVNHHRICVKEPVFNQLITHQNSINSVFCTKGSTVQVHWPSVIQKK